MSKHLLIAGAAAAVFAAAAPAAHADSIAYVKGGDIFLSTSDGSRQYQVTTGGGYSTVSQSDTGNIVALHGDHIRTLDRVTGAVRYDIRTPASSSFPGTNFRGPFDPVVSPNGVKIAYTWYYTDTTTSPSCNPSYNDCQLVYGRQGTGFTRPDAITGFDDYGFQSQSGWVDASWLDDGGVIASDPIQPLNEQTVMMTPGDEGNKLPGGTLNWWSNRVERSLRDVERNTAKTGFASVAGDDSAALHIYRPGGDYPNIPSDACFQITGAKGKYRSPSWKPDSTRLAWSDDDGIYTIAMPDLSASCGTPPETESKLLIPGGQLPDWGPADVPPARAVTPDVKTPADNGGKTPPKDGGGTVVTPPKGQSAVATLKVASSSKRKVRRSGLVIRVTGVAAGRHTITAKAGKATVGKGRVKVGAAGTGKVTLKLKRAVLAKKGKLVLKLSGAGLKAKVTLR